MATSYSSWVATDDYRTRIDYSVSSNTDTTAVVHGETRLQSGSGGYASNWSSSWDIVINGSKSSGSGTLSFGSNSTTGVLISKDVTITKTHSAQSISVKGTVSSYAGGAMASGTVTVAAKTSYAVTYDANGGSGAPAAQTKWYGETLTLSSTKPTRANYTFLGWSTSSTATTATYAAGASYTGNAALKLYAVWKLSAVSPQITSLSAFRSDASGNRIDDASAATTHITVNYGWSVDTGTTSRKIQISLGGTAQTAITLSANSGTGTVTYAKSLDIDKTLVVAATVTDSTHSLTATKSVTVPVVFKPFQMRNKGLSAAFFGVAGATWSRILKVFGDVRVHVENIDTSTNPSANTYSRGFYICDSSSADIGYSRAMKLTDGKQGLQLEARRVVSSATKYCTLNLLIDDAGEAQVSIGGTNAKYAYHKAFSPWTQLATAKSGTAMTFTLPTNCTEVMVAAVSSHTVSSIRAYAGSVVIPRDLLSTTNTEWLLGGGSANGGSSTSGIRYCAVRITTTAATGTGAYIDGTDRSSTTTFYVYAR